MYRDGASPLGVPVVAGPGVSPRVDLAAVLLHAALCEVLEEVLGDPGKRLYMCSVQPEDVVCAHEWNAKNLLSSVLDATGPA